MTTEFLNDGPAFPAKLTNKSKEPTKGFAGETVEPFEMVEYSGITVRDYFASRAPAIPKEFDWAPGETDSVQRQVRWNYHYADAMIIERDKPVAAPAAPAPQPSPDPIAVDPVNVAPNGPA